MPGNSQRQGARRKIPRKGSSVGTGGHNRRGLAGKGPTPPAERRPGHPAAKASSEGRTKGTGSGRSDTTRNPSGNPRGRSSGTSTSAGDSGRKPASRTSPGRGGAGRRAARPDGRPDGPEVVFGRNAVVEALRAGVPSTALYVAARIDSDERVRETVKLAGESRVPLLEAARSELDRLTGGGSHQGLALQVPAYRYLDPGVLLERVLAETEPALVVALDGVTDPRNLGAVVRSTAAFGGHGLLLPERRAAGMTAAAWKTSAGAAAHVPAARATNLSRAIEDYRKAGIFVAGLDGDGTTDIADLELADGPLLLVVGGEGRGLSRLVRSTCDVLARIPISAHTESLNAGVAAGIALYEIARRRR